MKSQLLWLTELISALVLFSLSPAFANPLSKQIDLFGQSRNCIESLKNDTEIPSLINLNLDSSPYALLGANERAEILVAVIEVLRGFIANEKEITPQSENVMELLWWLAENNDDVAAKEMIQHLIESALMVTAGRWIRLNETLTDSVQQMDILIGPLPPEFETRSGREKLMAGTLPQNYTDFLHKAKWIQELAADYPPLTWRSQTTAKIALFYALRGGWKNTALRAASLSVLLSMSIGWAQAAMIKLEHKVGLVHLALLNLGSLNSSHTIFDVNTLTWAVSALNSAQTLTQTLKEDHSVDLESLGPITGLARNHLRDLPMIDLTAAHSSEREPWQSPSLAERLARVFQPTRDLPNVIDIDSMAKEQFNQAQHSLSLNAADFLSSKERRTLDAQYPDKRSLRAHIQQAMLTGDYTQVIKGHLILAVRQKSEER